jgi:hypothetical protein
MSLDWSSLLGLACHRPDGRRSRNGAQLGGIVEPKAPVEGSRLRKRCLEIAQAMLAIGALENGLEELPSEPLPLLARLDSDEREIPMGFTWVITCEHLERPPHSWSITRKQKPHSHRCEPSAQASSSRWRSWLRRKPGGYTGQPMVELGGVDGLRIDQLMQDSGKERRQRKPPTSSVNHEMTNERVGCKGASEQTRCRPNLTAAKVAHIRLHAAFLPPPQPGAKTVDLAWASVQTPEP